MRNVLQNGSVEEWKDGRIAEWQNRSIYDGRMEWPFSVSVAPSVAELSDGGSPNRESQYSSQDLLVIRSLDI